MAKFLEAVSFVLKHEGGLSNVEGDQGEITNFGISLRFFKKNVKIDGTPDNIRNLSAHEAEGIYKRYFWDRAPYHEINSQHIANRLFDLAVNCGPSTAVGMIQRAINSLTYKSHLVVDGGLGIKTLDQINILNEVKLYNALIYEAIRFYHEIAEHKNNEIFLKGWLNRLTAPC